MSHYTRVSSKLTDQDMILKALTRMSLKYQVGEFTVSEYGQSEKAQILLDKSLGLSLQKDGTYSFVGDPYHCKTQGLRKYYRKLDKLSGELTTAYNIENAKDKLETQQFFCTDNEEATVGSDGMIRMVYTRI